MDHASLMSALEHIRGSLERGSVEEALALLDELSARAEESVDFQQVVDSLLDGMYITDQDAVTRYVNPAYCKHMGHYAPGGAGAQRDRDRQGGRPVSEVRI